ncbi:SAM-dependent methyltransferase [Streptosporangium jomthongense]
MREVDPPRPSPARVYDYLLGGRHNSKVDRDAAERVMRLWPVRELALANRRFLIAAVRRLTREFGVRQFIDIGSGLPTEQNVHQVAAPDSRVLYVDNDALVVAEGGNLLDGRQAGYIEGDLRDPHRIITHPETSRLIDPTVPTALMIIGMMHYITDADDPAGIIRDLMVHLAPGSFLVVSTATDTLPDEMRQAIDMYYRNPAAPLVWRSRETVERFFDGLEPVSPGLTAVEKWTDSEAAAGPWLVIAGMARKP